MSVQDASLATDTVLAEAVRAGDGQAFEEIFRRYYPTVYRVLLRLTGSPEEAEDLTQEVFIRLYRRPLPAHGDVNLGGWLYRTATNAGFNAIRARKRWHGRILRWARLERPLHDSPSPAAETERRDTAAAVRRALAELPERDRTVLVLRHSGVSYADIAAAIGVKPASVGTILVRAERALRARYVAMNPDAGKEQRSER